MSPLDPTSAWQDAVVATLRGTARVLEGDSSIAKWSRIGGNALSSVWSLAIGAARFFVKIADLPHADMLGAEAEGLQAIAQTGTVRVPDVIATGVAEGAAFLAVEWLTIVDGGRDAALGRALAALHAVKGERHGWHRDNTIGTTPQANGWSDEWATFFRDRRLVPQLALAAANGHRGKLQRDGERLADRVPELLAGHRPAASLLHGDLWAGNAGQLEGGVPVVFDPAVYYGDRETDLAMTELFGGFHADFYAAYREAAPLPAGYEVRRTLYNLYHVLNHLNLFGAAYRKQAEAMIGELLRKV
jgi:fructosamine-3-kinase